MSTPSVDYPNHIHHSPPTMNDAPPGCGNEYGQHQQQHHIPTDFHSSLLSRSSPPPHPPLPGIIAFPSRRSGAAGAASAAAAVRGVDAVRASLAPPPDAALVGVGGGIGDEKRERMMLSLAASSSSLAYASAAATFARSEEEAFRKRAAERGLAARRAAEAALIRAADGSAVLRAERRAASSAADEESKSSSGSSSSASASASAGEGDSYDGDRDADFFRGRRRRRSRLSLTAYERRILLENSSSSPPPPPGAASSSPQKRAVSLLAPSVPRVSPSDVTVGEILGRGGFSDVYDVRRLGERARSSVAAAAALAAAAQVLNEDEEEGQEEGEDDVLREEKDEDRKEEEEEDSSSDLSDNEDVAFAAAAAAASIAANASFPAATTRGQQQQQGRRNRSSSFAAERRSSTAAVGGSRRGSAFSASAAFGSASRRGSALSLRGSIKAMATRRRSSAAARRRSSTAAAQRRRSSAVSINLQDVFNENNAGNDDGNVNVVGSHHSDSKRRSFNGSLRDMAKKAVEVAKMCSRRTSSCSGADASDLFDEEEYYDSLLPDNSNKDRHIGHRYALKQLSSETWWGNASALKNGAADLVLEAAYLSALQTPGHPGLIKLHGLSEGGCAALESSCPSRALETTTVTKNGIVEPSSFGNNGVHPPPAPFFLILDRLDCTLDEKIHSQWSARGRGGDNATRSGGLGRRATSLRNLRKMAGHHHHHHDGGRSAAAMALEDAAALTASDDDPSASLAERLSVARDVASALAYLHGRRMLHRDVKPDNIGFDMQGNVKIFDLGLAKELKPSQAVDGGDGRNAEDDSDETLYKLTGRTGSRTYMAPEVSLSLPYGLSADVYSFSVMLWELCALRRPYEGLSADEHDTAVVRGYVRPDSPELRAASRRGGGRGSGDDDEEEEALWSDDLRFLMGSGWDADCRMRPSMEEVRDALKAEILKLGGTLSKAAEMEAEAAARGGSTAASVGSGGGGARPSRALAA